MSILSDLADILAARKREYQRRLDLKAENPGYEADDDLDESRIVMMQAQTEYDRELDKANSPHSKEQT